MDKRQNTRFAIELNALVHPQNEPSWLCTIRDFCRGGMLLLEQETGPVRSTMPGIHPGETVGIHYYIPTKNKDLHFRLEGQIVRVMRTGLGIKFKEEMADHAITALMNHANSRTSSALEPKSAVAERRVAEDNTLSPASRISEANSEVRRLNLADEDLSSGKISQADTRKIIAAIREEVTKLLLEINAAFFSYMDDELLKLARDAKSNAEQSEYFAAMSNLEKAKEQVKQSFIQEVLIISIILGIFERYLRRAAKRKRNERNSSLKKFAFHS